MTIGRLFKKLFPKSAALFQLNEKQFSEQIVPLSDMPVYYFKDSVMKRDKPESLRTQMSEEGQKSPLLISLISNTKQKKTNHR